jgi:hypothetical protein
LSSDHLDLKAFVNVVRVDLSLNNITDIVKIGERIG